MATRNPKVKPAKKKPSKPASEAKESTSSRGKSEDKLLFRFKDFTTVALNCEWKPRLKGKFFAE